MNDYERMAEMLLQSHYAGALTGAGISVESGIPDFRSENGLWAKYDPMEYGDIESFRANPAKVWKMLLEMDTLLGRALPNPGHVALAQLEQQGILKAVVTQNVDSLHQKAGSLQVIEFHGHNRTLRCEECRRRFARENVFLDKIPPLCSCGSPLRPEFVFFGEEIPLEAYQQAMAAAQHCDLMLVVGTSATVAPASYLPRTAKRRGAAVVEVNPKATQLSYDTSDLHLAEPAGRALPAVMAALDALRAERRKKSK